VEGVEQLREPAVNGGVGRGQVDDRQLALAAQQLQDRRVRRLKLVPESKQFFGLLLPITRVTRWAKIRLLDHPTYSLAGFDLMTHMLPSREHTTIRGDCLPM
jgi:hypothetical protein